MIETTSQCFYLHQAGIGLAHNNDNWVAKWILCQVLRRALTLMSMCGYIYTDINLYNGGKYSNCWILTAGGEKWSELPGNYFPRQLWKYFPGHLWIFFQASQRNIIQASFGNIFQASFGNIFLSSSSHHSTTLDTTVKLNKGESTQKFSQFIKSCPGFFTWSRGGALMLVLTLRSYTRFHFLVTHMTSLNAVIGLQWKCTG